MEKNNEEQIITKLCSLCTCQSISCVECLHESSQTMNRQRHAHNSMRSSIPTCILSSDLNGLEVSSSAFLELFSSLPCQSNPITSKSRTRSSISFDVSPSSHFSNSLRCMSTQYFTSGKSEVIFM
mmetsp:Transcript_20586/g.26630  ORF Transcript_20586/g.26630 Transcript_20586/m.26630 type:complete len:125 (+) Transcript_20586:1315-1689(+)